MGNKLTGRDLIKLGFPKNNSINIALGQISRYRKREKKDSIINEAKDVLLHPENYKNNGTWGKVAEGLVNPVQVRMHQLQTTRAPFSIFGENEIDEQAKFQLYDALKLPISVAGALMPDAHSGYGLPIGGVLATDNAVIPYGVGVDIGCRMSLSIFDLPASFIKGKDHQLQAILKEHTKFGMNETHAIKADHEIFSRSEFQDIPLLKSLHKSRSRDFLKIRISRYSVAEKFADQSLQAAWNIWWRKPFCRIRYRSIRCTITRVEVRSRKLFLCFITQWFTRYGRQYCKTLHVFGNKTMSVTKKCTAFGLARFEHARRSGVLVGNEFSRRLCQSMSR